MQKVSSVELGRAGENIACEWLEQNGYRIVERNYRTAHGEIDIIAEYDKYICFIEVKSRADNAAYIRRYGRPSDAVNSAKKQHLLYAVKNYMSINKPDRHPRIDVFEIYIRDGKPVRFNYIKAAFGADKHG